MTKSSLNSPWTSLHAAVCAGVDVNECDSEPCQNGGVCQDRDAQYTCVCSAEYYGPDCQHSE